MPLTKQQIRTFNKIKSRTNCTDFQYSIVQNNTELFFDFINHFKNKIDLNQILLSHTKKTLVQQAYVSSKTSFNKSTDIFDFLYNHSEVDIYKESKDGDNLLTLAAYHKDLLNFERFEKDGFKETSEKQVIVESYRHLPILGKNVDFSMLKRTLQNSNYKFTTSNRWLMNGMIEYYYKNKEPSDIKEIILDLSLRSKYYFNYGDYYESSVASNYFDQIIEKDDVSFFQELINRKDLLKVLKNKDFEPLHFPIYKIIKSDSQNIFKYYLENNLLSEIKIKEKHNEILSLLIRKPFGQSKINFNEQYANLLINEMLLDIFYSGPTNSMKDRSFIQELFFTDDDIISEVTSFFKKSPIFAINTDNCFNLLYNYSYLSKNKEHFFSIYEHYDFNKLDKDKAKNLFEKIINNNTSIAKDNIQYIDTIIFDLINKTQIDILPKKDKPSYIDIVLNNKELYFIHDSFLAIYEKKLLQNKLNNSDILNNKNRNRI